MTLADEESALIAALHNGPCEQPYWAMFAELLSKQCDADYVSFALWRSDARIGDISLTHAGRQLPDPHTDLLEKLHRRFLLPYVQMEPGRVYALDELLDLTQPALSALKAGYLAPNNYNYMRVVRIASPDGSNAWLAMTRSSRDFDVEDQNLLARLVPHLKISIRMLATIESERLRADIAAQAVHRLNFVWLTLDEQGRVVELDPEASRLLALVRAFSNMAPGRPFRAPTLAYQDLKATLALFSKDTNAKPQAFHVADDPWLDMLLLPMRSQKASGATQVAVAYIHGESEPSAQRCDQLMQHFDLSRNEALLALSLSRGRSIAEAAAKLNLTIETARNYTKRIYAKTGTRGQADLVRLILASVVALA